jgi:bisphosphoglycerate-dependent phosphoglycerate mutase
MHVGYMYIGLWSNTLEERDYIDDVGRRKSKTKKVFTEKYGSVWTGSVYYQWIGKNGTFLKKYVKETVK